MFIYVMKFLQEILKYSQWNQLDVDFLVILFSHTFLGLPINAEANNEETAAVWNTVMAIVRFLLTPPKEGSEKEEGKDSESDD